MSSATYTSGRESVAHERQRAEVMAECELRGVRVTQVGALFHLRGRGVDLRVTDLRHVLPDDFADIRRVRSNP